MSSSRQWSQTTKPNGSIPRGGRLLSLIFALSRNPNRQKSEVRGQQSEDRGQRRFSLAVIRPATASLSNGGHGESVLWRIREPLTVIRVKRRLLSLPKLLRI